MIERAAIRFTPDDWYYMEIDKDDVTCSVTGFMDGIPVDFFGDVEEGMMYLGELEWNQLTKNNRASVLVSGIQYTNNGDGSYTVNGTANANAACYTDSPYDIAMIPSHIYLVCGCPIGGSGSTYRLGLTQGGVSVASDYGNGKIAKASNTDTGDVSTVIFIANGVTVNDLKFTPQVFDLTQMFGSDIADGIYAMEQAEAGSGVAFFKTLFAPEDYYEYNAGEDMIITLRKKVE